MRSKKSEVAREVPDPTPDLDALALDVEAEDRGRSRLLPLEVQERADRRGLPRTVRSEEAEDLARLDLQVEILDAAVVAVALRELVRLDSRRST